ncbi:hypothetical protein O59_003802 [Cellvibrio sp. BR]|nr:hypothetical protein O59_003802 [Cellvibrio sp. BR]
MPNLCTVVFLINKVMCESDYENWGSFLTQIYALFEGELQKLYQ